MKVHLTSYQGEVECGTAEVGDQATGDVSKTTCTGCMVGALLVLHNTATILWGRMHSVTEEQMEKEN